MIFSFFYLYTIKKIVYSNLMSIVLSPKPKPKLLSTLLLPLSYSLTPPPLSIGLNKQTHKQTDEHTRTERAR